MEHVQGDATVIYVREPFNRKLTVDEARLVVGRGYKVSVRVFFCVLRVVYVTLGRACCLRQVLPALCSKSTLPCVPKKVLSSPSPSPNLQ